MDELGHTYECAVEEPLERRSPGRVTMKWEVVIRQRGLFGKRAAISALEVYSDEASARARAVELTINNRNLAASVRRLRETGSGRPRYLAPEKSSEAMSSMLQSIDFVRAARRW